MVNSLMMLRRCSSIFDVTGNILNIKRLRANEVEKWLDVICVEGIVMHKGS